MGRPPLQTHEAGPLQRSKSSNLRLHEEEHTTSARKGGLERVREMKT